jgi:hypothetical protein
MNVVKIIYVFVYTVIRPISISVRLAMNRDETDEHTPLIDADVAMDELEVLVSRQQVYIIDYNMIGSNVHLGSITTLFPAFIDQFYLLLELHCLV